jgi:hypothetical protein
MDNQRPKSIPSELDHLIQLNVAYRVLICPHTECRKAVQPRAFSEHLRVQHQTPLRDRERVQEYIKGFGWDYDFSTIQLPEDGSRPQPIIPVVDGCQCRTCPFKSGNRKSMKVHGNKEHKQQRVGDDELFWKVRLQSWFQDHRQRYWVVDEGKRGDGHTDVGIREEEESASRLGLRDDEGVVDASTDVGNDEVEEIGVGESRDEEGGGEVGNEVVEKVVDEGVEVIVDNQVGEEVVDDEEEVFSAFDDSWDGDYRESSEDVVEDGEGDSSEVEVDGSDDEDYEQSSGVIESEEEEGSSEIGVNKSDDGVQSSGVADDDEGEVIRPVDCTDSSPSRKWRARKRKMQSKFEESGVTGIDSEDGRCWDSSPGFGGRGRRGTKRQRRMSCFEDSGVVMGSSQNDSEMVPNGQDDDIVPPSSPPIFGWMSKKRPEGFDDGLGLPEAAGATNDDQSGDENDVPFQHRVICQHGRAVQSRLDHLEERLEKWCRTCPACYLAGDFGGEIHHMSDCWRRGTVEIIDQAAIMRQHIRALGGFRGRGSCPWCGVPRAICQQWHVSIEGGGRRRDNDVNILGC